MQAWEAIQITVEYIEKEIKNKIEISELANLAGLSIFYYQRLFASLVKKPVREYIKLRRLALASKNLLNKKNRIIDVAVDYGFINHETFTRAFKETYGITPKRYREKNIKLQNFDKPNLLLNYVMVDEGVPLITDGLVLEYNIRKINEPIKFVGVKGYYRFKTGKMLGERPGISEPSVIWDNFYELADTITKKEFGKTIGVSYHGDAEDDYSTYFVGVECENESIDPKHFNWILPAREYLVCHYEAENFEELVSTASGKAMKHIRFWLREHGLTADGFFPEIYYSNSYEDVFMEMWIPFKKRENK